jgi:hypothetical protein
VGVVQDAVDHGGTMLAHHHDQAAWRQLVGAQVDLAARSDLHCRMPDEAERCHVILEPLPLGDDAIARRTRAPAGSPGRALHTVAVGEGIIDLAIGPVRGDGDGASDAVACLSLEAGRFCPPSSKMILIISACLAKHLVAAQGSFGRIWWCWQIARFA